MSYTESVQELVKELRQGKYMPVQQRAADELLLLARVLDTLEGEVERLANPDVLPFGMRE